MSTGSSVNNTLKLKLQGYTLGSNIAISSSDKLIEALGNIQAQINAFSGGSGFIPLSGTTALAGSIVPNAAGLTLGSNSGLTTHFSTLYATALRNQFGSVLLVNGGTTGLQLTHSTRNVIIQDGGTFTDNGNRLQVTGNQSITGNITAGGAIVADVGGSFQSYNVSGANYERVRSYWNSNTYTIAMELSGTGVARNLVFSTNGSNRVFTINQAPVNGIFNFLSNSSSPQIIIGTTGTHSNSSGISGGIGVFDTYNQSGTAGYRAIWVSPYEQATGSGSKLLLDLGTNSAANGVGTHTSRFTIANDGTTTIYNKADIYGGSLVSLNLGSDASNSTTRTNSTDKVARLGVPHYNTGANPMAVVFANSTSSANILSLGGSTAFMNAATEINFFTGSTTTSDSGTVAGKIFGTGNWFIGTSPVDNSYKLEVNGTTQLTGNTTITGTLGVSTSVTTPTIISTGNLTVQAATGGQLRLQNSSSAALTVFNNSQGLRVQIQQGGTYTDIPSARLAVNSTTEGFLTPRMTTAQKNAISSPANGLIVYDTTLNELSNYNGTEWKTSVSANSSGGVVINTTASAALRLIRSPLADYGFELGGADIGLYNYKTASYPLFIKGSGNILIGSTTDNGLAKLQTPSISLGTGNWHYSSDGQARLFYTANSHSYFRTPAGHAKCFSFGTLDSYQMYADNLIQFSDNFSDWTQQKHGASGVSNRLWTHRKEASGTDYRFFDWNGTSARDWWKVTATAGRFTVAEVLHAVYGVSVGIGTASPNVNTILDVVSTNKLARPVPSMTTTEANAIATKVAGGMYYDTTTNKMRFWNGSAYETITSA